MDKPLKSRKLRDSARGQDCTFQIPGICNHNPETTVLCHIAVDGSTMGSKTHDYSAAFGCSDCHVAIDQHRLPGIDEYYYTRRAMVRTWHKWVEMGLLRFG